MTYIPPQHRRHLTTPLDADDLKVIAENVEVSDGGDSRPLTRAEAEAMVTRVVGVEDKRDGSRHMNRTGTRLLSVKL